MPALDRPARPALGHRPALDGFRGAAVVLVLFGHIGVRSIAPAGTVGVTLFFVLSGFLITMLLLDEQGRRGAVHLGHFYARRALRLFPPLVLVLVVVGAYAARTGLVDAPLGYAVSYRANVAAMRGVDLGVFGHTWSLALEEQFYLVWPVVLVTALRRHIGWATAAAVLGIVASLLANVVIVQSNAPIDQWARLTFGPDTRSHALFVGCLLALVLPRLLGSRLLAAAPLPALAVITFASLTDDRTATYSLLILPAAAAAGGVLIVRLFEGSGAIIDGVGRWRPLRYVGRISYGLYLWHFPIFVALGPHLLGAPRAVRATVGIATSIAVAATAYHLVEQPFLALKRYFVAGDARSSIPVPRYQPRSVTFVAALVAVVLSVGVGVAVSRSVERPPAPSQEIAGVPVPEAASSSG